MPDSNRVKVESPITGGHVTATTILQPGQSPCSVPARREPRPNLGASKAWYRQVFGGFVVRPALDIDLRFAFRPTLWEAREHLEISMKKTFLFILVISAFALGTQQPARADGVSFGFPLPFPFAFYNFGGPGYYSQPYYRAYYYNRPYWGGYYRRYWGPRPYWGGYYHRYWGRRFWR
jgi:hypothetical protein